MSDYTDFEEIKEEEKGTEYSHTSKDIKADIDKIMGVKSKDTSKINIRATLVGAVVGGGIAVYSGWKVWLGIVVGALIGGVVNKKY